MKAQMLRSLAPKTGGNQSEPALWARCPKTLEDKKLKVGTASDTIFFQIVFMALGS